MTESKQTKTDAETLEAHVELMAKIATAATVREFSLKVSRHPLQYGTLKYGALLQAEKMRLKKDGLRSEGPLRTFFTLGANRRRNAQVLKDIKQRDAQRLANLQAARP
jgi:hypothetical protein